MRVIHPNNIQKRQVHFELAFFIGLKWAGKFGEFREIQISFIYYRIGGFPDFPKTIKAYSHIVRGLMHGGREIGEQGMIFQTFEPVGESFRNIHSLVV